MNTLTAWAFKRVQRVDSTPPRGLILLRTGLGIEVKGLSTSRFQTRW